ncbi:MAG: hypothetical protein WCV85_04375 [Patescibacteria group bacterium]|jgi:hypothetical protein
MELGIIFGDEKLTEFLLQRVTDDTLNAQQSLDMQHSVIVIGRQKNDGDKIMHATFVTDSEIEKLPTIVIHCLQAASSSRFQEASLRIVHVGKRTFRKKAVAKKTAVKMMEGRQTFLQKYPNSLHKIDFITCNNPDLHNALLDVSFGK